MAVLLIIIFAILCLHLHYKNKQYKEGAYYQITKNPYSSIKYDKGKHGEYLTYLSLKHFEDNGCKFLFNLYIPKENSKTTEIDVVLISSKGIFVFECKNYSGWVFGNELQSKWTQTLPQGRGRCHKEYFYNPIKQNASHIRYLKTIVGRKIPIWSVIVFSDKCTLKNIAVRSNDVIVINRRSVAHVVAEICNKSEADAYTESDIKYIFSKLYPYTQSNHDIKEQHIEHIHQASNYDIN